MTILRTYIQFKLRLGELGLKQRLGVNRDGADLPCQLDKSGTRWIRLNMAAILRTSVAVNDNHQVRIMGSLWGAKNRGKVTLCNDH